MSEQFSGFASLASGEFVVGKGNAPPFGRYVSQALVYFGANKLIVSEVSLERFEKLDFFVGLSCISCHLDLFGV